jgi:hypothetical protein
VDKLPPNTRIEIEHGRKVVYVTHNTSDAGPVVIRQAFEDIICHHYGPRGIGEDIPLYAGVFSLNGEASRTYIGDVRFMWNPTPRVMARGETESQILDFLDEGDVSSGWTRMGEVIIDTSSGLPPQPAEANQTWSKANGSSWMEDRIASPDVGNGDGLDRVTFLVPNGWQNFTGTRIRDAEKPWRWWTGRFTAEGGDWRVTVDPLPGQTDEFWRTLKQSGSSVVTHVGQLSRLDGSSFGASDTVSPLNAIRLALSLALGRSTQCLLPVGWRGGTPVWSNWHTGSVDRMRNVHSLLDPTESPDQLKQLIELCLKFCDDSYREEVLQYAISYLITANYDVNVELAVALPISALQLIAYYRFVEDRKIYSKGKWDDLNTGKQIRLLLTDCSIGTSIPNHFAHLKTVQSTLGPLGDGTQRDALHCIVKMRNTIIHPTRDKPATWTVYQWAEASLVALDYLRLAILNMVEYVDSIRTATQESKWVGALTKVPWAP